MESYWERASRGAARNAGTTFLTNPTANTGMTPGGFDWDNVIVSGQGAGYGASQMGPAWDAANATQGGRVEQSLQTKLFKQAQQAQEAQQAAVKSRLDEQINGYKERRSTAAKAMKGAGKIATDEINRNFDNLVGRTRGQMQSSGLGQTSIMGTTVAGIERDRAAALRDAASKSAMDATSVDLQTSGDYLNFLGGIEDEFDQEGLVDLAKENGEGTQNQLDNSAWGGGGGMMGFGAAPFGANPYGGAGSYGIPGAGGGGGGYPAEAFGPQNQQWLTPEEQQQLMGQNPQVNPAATRTNRRLPQAALQVHTAAQQLLANDRMRQGAAVLQAQARRRMAERNGFQ